MVTQCMDSRRNMLASSGGRAGRGEGRSLREHGRVRGAARVVQRGAGRKIVGWGVMGGGHAVMGGHAGHNLSLAHLPMRTAEPSAAAALVSLAPECRRGAWSSPGDVGVAEEKTPRAPVPSDHVHIFD